MRLYWFICCVIGMLGISALSVEAVPAFARQYGLGCQTCHQGPPRLNAFGRHFQERGYRMPAGAAQVKSETRLPLGLRIKNLVTIRKTTTENRHEFDLPQEVHLLSGGAFLRGFSYYVDFPILINGNVGTPILAFVQMNSLTGSDLLNVRAGKFNVLGFQFTHHRMLGFTPQAATAVPVGNNPAVLDDHQVGFKIYGRPRAGPFFYEVALVTGVGPQASSAQVVHGHTHGTVLPTDLDDFKDVFVRVAYDTPGRMFRFGALGYLGNTPLGAVPNVGAQTAPPDGSFQKQSVFYNGVHAGFDPVNVSDRFRILGLDGDLNFGRLSLRSAIYNVHHDNPFTNNIWVDYQSGFVEMSYAFSRQLWGLVQYDQVYAKYFKAVERKTLTPHVSYLFLENVRFSIEYFWDLDTGDNSRAFFMLDVTM